MLVSTMIKLRYCLFVVWFFVCLFNRNAHYWYIRLSFQRKCSIMMPKVNNSLSDFQNKTSGSSLFKSHYESTKPIRSLRGYYCNLYEPPYLSVFAFMALLCYKKSSLSWAPTETRHVRYTNAWFTNRTTLCVVALLFSRFSASHMVPKLVGSLTKCSNIKSLWGAVWLLMASDCQKVSITADSGDLLARRGKACWNSEEGCVWLDLSHSISDQRWYWSALAVRGINHPVHQTSA